MELLKSNSSTLSSRAIILVQHITRIDLTENPPVFLLPTFLIALASQLTLKLSHHPTIFTFFSPAKDEHFSSLAAFEHFEKLETTTTGASEWVEDTGELCEQFFEASNMTGCFKELISYANTLHIPHAQSAFLEAAVAIHMTLPAPSAFHFLSFILTHFLILCESETLEAKKTMEDIPLHPIKAEQSVSPTVLDRLLMVTRRFVMMLTRAGMKNEEWFGEFLTICTLLLKSLSSFPSDNNEPICGCLALINTLLQQLPATPLVPLIHTVVLSLKQRMNKLMTVTQSLEEALKTPSSDKAEATRTGIDQDRHAVNMINVQLSFFEDLLKKHQT
ncbi:hypothetical protein BLNAU_14801 [Blattamonas nauphoetae]|uniref:Uncharacterized protein n=1 Tax=Blattamonas nauphoetae TaxID=2049346 RepID=A0ABQ9XHV7_9EUKA|nr:hypothetical protein BLNAU_14801 [Blattamonas nauphoetae]